MVFATPMSSRLAEYVKRADERWENTMKVISRIKLPISTKRSITPSRSPVKFFQQAPFIENVQTSQAETQPTTKLFVYGINKYIDEPRLKSFFTSLGKIEVLNVEKPRNWISRKFCFVTLSNWEDAQHVLSLNGKLIRGSNVLTGCCKLKMDDNGYPVYSSAYDFASGADEYDLNRSSNFNVQIQDRVINQHLGFEDKVDGVVYVSVDPSFFQPYSPFSFRRPFTEFITAKKFKGLSDWHGEKDKLYEVKLSYPRDYIFSLIIAMKSRTWYDFPRFHELIIAALRNSINKSPSDTKDELARSTADETPTIMSANDWSEIGRNWMKEIKSLVRLRKPFEREDEVDFTFVLYHFGDNLALYEFIGYSNWITPKKLDFLILHVARDVSVHRHVIFFKPENICHKLKKAIPSAQVLGPYIFRSGLQSGYGNVRVALLDPKPNARSTNSRNLPMQSLRSLTWYTRLNQGMHRDEFFGNFNFIKFFEKVYEQLIFKDIKTVDKAKVERQLWKLVSGKVSDKLVGASTLTMPHYSGRIEAVQVKTKEELRQKEIPAIVSSLFTETTAWIENNGIIASQIVHAKHIDVVADELKQWLSYFAGTIHLIFRKLFCLHERRTGQVPHIASGTVSAKEILLYEDVVSLQAVGYLIDGYISGRFFCNKTWRRYLNITQAELKTDNSNERLYDPKFRFKNLRKQLEEYEVNSEKKMFKVIKLDMREFPEELHKTRPRIFLAEVPRFYAEFLQQKDAYLSLKRNESRTNRQLVLASSLDIADSLVKLFLSCVLFNSGINLEDAVTLETMYNNTTFKSASYIITTDELVSTIYGEINQGRASLEDSCLFIRTILSQNKSLLHNNFKSHLVSCFNSFIVEEGYPIVIPRMEGKTTKSVRVIVPQLFDKSFLDNFNETEQLRKVDNFNRAWSRAALKITCFADTSNSTFAAYECFSSMNVVDLRKLNVPQVARCIASCRRFHEFRLSNASIRKTALDELESLKDVSDDLKMNFLCGSTVDGQFWLNEDLLTDEERFNLQNGDQNRRSSQPTGEILSNHQLDGLNILEMLTSTNQKKYCIRNVKSGRFKNQYVRLSRRGQEQSLDSTSTTNPANDIVEKERSRQELSQDLSAEPIPGPSNGHKTAGTRKRFGARTELNQGPTPKLPKPNCLSKMSQRLQMACLGKTTSLPSDCNQSASDETTNHDQNLDELLESADADGVHSSFEVDEDPYLDQPVVPCQMQLHNLFLPIIPSIEYLQKSRGNQAETIKEVHKLASYYNNILNKNGVSKIRNYWGVLAYMLNVNVETLTSIYNRWMHKKNSAIKT